MLRRLALAIPALLLITSCSNKSNTTPTPSGPTVSITSGASTKTTTAYSPNPMSLARGSSLTWVNNDNTAHTSTGDGAGTWNSGSIAPGGSFTTTFNTAGSFTYHCTLHAGMVGTINVQ